MTAQHQGGISYEGSQSAELGMALGGLGTSTLEIGRDGAFQNLRLQNDWTQSLNPTPLATFLSLHVRTAGSPGAGRVLQLTAPGGLPPVAALSYTGRFPFVELVYRDPALACEATMEAFCPFIPRDAESSSTPIIFFTFRIRNPMAQPITVAAAMSWVNDIAAETWRNGGWPAEGNRNTRLSLNDLPAIRMDTRQEPMRGSEYLLTCLPSAGVRYSAVADWWTGTSGRWKGPDYFRGDEKAVQHWKVFLEQGHLPPESRYDDGLEMYSYHKPVGAVAGEALLASGDAREFRFALMWYFPHHADRQCTKAPLDLGHHYAARFPQGTRDVAAWAVPRRDDLRDRSLAWRRLFEDSSLPRHLKALMTETLYLLPRISWWTADGRFCLYESIDCPRIHPTILEIYMAPVLAALFPDLHERALRLIAAAQLDTGEIPSTLGKCSLYHHEYRVFNPGDVSVFPIAVAWQMLWEGDTRFAADLFPVVKRVLQWGLQCLDLDKDGIPDVHGIDQGWDTFPMHGAASYIADQWMAALLAGECMARHLDDRKFADWCADARRKAAATAETRLWNGRYYNLADQPATGRKSDICFMDQFTYGTVAANILELGAVHPPERVRRSLESIWQLNVKPCEVVARMGSNSDGAPADCTDHPREDGASQSNAFTPVSVAPYCAALIQHGLVAQALELAEQMAEVIIRRAQAPWSGQLLFNSRNGNWFYGKHYSDCLVIWDILHALLGVHINMWERRLSLAPAGLPLKLPLFSALFCGQVEMQSVEERLHLSLHNLTDQPSSISILRIQIPAEHSAGAAVVTEGQARSIEIGPTGQTVIRDAVVPPLGRWHIQWEPQLAAPRTGKKV